jgi:hypothetical protein
MEALRQLFVIHDGSPGVIGVEDAWSGGTYTLAMSPPPNRLPWAFGYKHFGNEELPDHLLELAKTRARAAVRAADFSYIVTDAGTTIQWLDAAIHAGSAIEILAKYYLSKVSPVLILDNAKLKDSDYLHAVGHSELVPPDPKFRALNLRTRGPRECLALIGMMTGNTTIGLDCADAALAARNAAIHLGLVDRAELQAALINFAQVISELLSVCGIASNDFWTPDTRKLVSALEAEQTFYDDLDKKFADARQKIVGKTITPATDAELAEIGSEDRGLTIWNTHWKKVPCPVCSAAATLSGGERISTDQTGEEVFRTSVLAVPEELMCDVCELTLTQRELKQVQLDRFWEVEQRWATDREIDLYYDIARG